MRVTQVKLILFAALRRVRPRLGTKSHFSQRWTEQSNLSKLTVFIL
jgi:hypothetical protein